MTIDYCVDIEICGDPECMCPLGFEFLCPNCRYVCAESETSAFDVFENFERHKWLNKPLVLICPKCGLTIESEPLTEENSRDIDELEFKEVNNGQS